MVGWSAGRVVGLVLVLLLAVALQTSFFSHLAWQGVVPNLTMLVVIAVAHVRGPVAGMVVGFVSGLLLDLAPPADHVAGRWALALVLVGWLIGTLRPHRGEGPEGAERPGQRVSVLGVLGAVAACSFIATSVMALTGLLVDDLDASVPDLLQVVLIALVLDLVAAPFVLWPVSRLLGRTPERRAAGRWGRR